jgi:transposase-like protein
MPTCPYYQITDAKVHALVGDGSHGKGDRIQTFRCQACRTTFSARRNTPLYRLKTPASRVGEVLTALCEGLDVAAAGRVFGYHPVTITAWLTRAGEQSTRLHQRTLQHLTLAHLQLDELRTRLRCWSHVLWLWLAIDPVSKLIPVRNCSGCPCRWRHSAQPELGSLVPLPSDKWLVRCRWTM